MEKEDPGGPLLTPAEERIFELARPCLQVRDNERHTRNALVFATDLLKTFAAEKTVVVPATILHDVGWSRLSKEMILKAWSPRPDMKLLRLHEEEGAKIALTILSEVGYDRAVTTEIIEIIRGHDTRTSPLSLNDIANSSVEAEIDVEGIYTGVDSRDRDLRGPNYFDVEKYPKIVFRSTRVEAAGLDHCLVHGDLTIRNVTRPVTLDVHFAGPSHFRDDDRLYTTYGFRAETMINREDFGLMRNLELENGGFMVGKHARLTISSEADLMEEK